MDETNTFPRPRRSGRRRGGTCVAMRAPLLLSRAYSAEGGCLATPKGVPSLQPPRVFGLAISESSTASPRKFRRAFGRWAAGTIDRPPRSSHGVPPSTQCRCRSGREDAEDHVPAPALPAPPTPQRARGCGGPRPRTRATRTPGATARSAAEAACRFRHAFCRGAASTRSHPPSWRPRRPHLGQAALTLPPTRWRGRGAGTNTEATEAPEARGPSLSRPSRRGGPAAAPRRRSSDAPAPADALEAAPLPSREQERQRAHLRGLLW